MTPLRKQRSAARLGVALASAVAAGAVTLTAAAPGPAVGTPSPALDIAGSRPNIVLITTDDQTLAELAWMPITRRILGDRGVEFVNGLSPHPLCCPARAMILTGQHAQNNGVRTNQGPYGGFDQLDSENTVATWLQGAGYRTAFVGKYINGYTADDGREPGWDIFNPTVEGVYSYYGFTMYNNGDPLTYSGIHNADLVGRTTAEYVEQLAGDQPFFIWSSQVAPHGTCGGNGCGQAPTAAVRHANDFSTVTAPQLDDPAFNEQDLSDKPPRMRNLPEFSTERSNKVFRAKIRSLQAVDEAVDRTVRALRRTGELDETLIAFTSDNGQLLGEHRYHGKDVPYEQALRVPFLVRGPGVPQGVRRTQPATTIDLAPTFLAVSDAQANIPVDGRSLLPALAQDDEISDENVLIQSGPRNAAQEAVGWNFRGVRTDRYTYARHTASGFLELYDRIADPHQLANVAEDPGYAEIVHELDTRATQLGECSGESCRVEFAPLPDPLAPPEG